MGRHPKTVLTPDGVDRRDSGYYSTPALVAGFIARKLLEVHPHGRSVLDPCVGREELLGTLHAAGKLIDSFDVIDHGSHERSSFERLDFLEHYLELSRKRVPGTSLDLKYDYYVANPPYNCHELESIRSAKRQLRSAFSETGVDNTCSMFLAAMIDCAKPGAAIGVLIQDSFLTARAYAGLRRKILRECRVHYLVLCPTDLFLAQGADVRTAVLVLQKRGPGAAGPDPPVRCCDRPASTRELEARIEGDAWTEVRSEDLVLAHAEDHGELLVGCPPSVRALFARPRLGQLFPCVTGISTGDDARYISEAPTEQSPVPFYKNPGSQRFFMRPSGYLPADFLRLAREAPTFLVRNKRFLFRQGISCSSMGVRFGACLLPEGSTFGVNASVFCPSADLWWLMAYLNSSLVTYLVRGVLRRTNMVTAGYVARLPLLDLEPDAKAELERLGHLGHECAAAGREVHQVLRRIDELSFGCARLPAEAVAHVEGFCSDLIRRA